jgi:hypothetical protein
VRLAAYAYTEGMMEGARAALRTVAVGASWSAQIYTWHYCRWVHAGDESRAWPFDLAARRAREHERTALAALADLGDECARGMLP